MRALFWVGGASPDAVAVVGESDEALKKVMLEWAGHVPFQGKRLKDFIDVKLAELVEDSTLQVTPETTFELGDVEVRCDVKDGEETK